VVQCLQESAGKRLGTAGKQIGTPHLKWAFSEAAVPLLRQHQPGQEYCAKRERNHGKGQALTVRARKLARAGYCMLTRHQAFALTRFVPA
jgi:hypothetical protein